MHMQKNVRGQALVTLLFFVIIGVSVVAGAAAVVYTNVLAASTVEQGEGAYYVAQSGIEEGLLQLLRNPNYAGETLPVGSGSVTIQVASGTITATGTLGNSSRKIQVQTVYNTNGQLTIVTWKEIN